MKKFKKQTLVVISGLTMLMSAGTALSSTTSAAATINWNTFAITGYGLGADVAPSYTLIGQSANTSSNVSDWVNWNSNTYNNSSSFSASTDGTGVGFGSADATRNATINVVGNGFLVLSANYYINAAISDPNYNLANASVDFVLHDYNNYTNSFTSSSQDSINLGTFGNPATTSSYKYGTLSLSFKVYDGEVLNFSSSVSAHAQDYNSIPATLTAVPVPAALWLFSSALVGLVGLGRPRKAAMG